MQHKRWQDGRLSTGFIAEEYPDGFHPVTPEGATAETIAAVAAAVDHVLGERKRRISGQMTGREVTRERRRAVRLGDLWLTLEVSREAQGIAVQFFDADGKAGPSRVLTSAWKPGEPAWSGFVHGHPVVVQVRPIANGFLLSHRGVTEGQEVKVGEALAIVEAMKMENVLRAERDATVKSIKVKPGDSLAVDAVIMEFA